MPIRHVRRCQLTSRIPFPWPAIAKTWERKPRLPFRYGLTTLDFLYFECRRYAQLEGLPRQFRIALQLQLSHQQL